MTKKKIYNRICLSLLPSTQSNEKSNIWYIILQSKFVAIMLVQKITPSWKTSFLLYIKRNRWYIIKTYKTTLCPNFSNFKTGYFQRIDSYCIYISLLLFTLLIHVRHGKYASVIVKENITLGSMHLLFETYVLTLCLDKFLFLKQWKKKQFLDCNKFLLAIYLRYKFPT